MGSLTKNKNKKFPRSISEMSEEMLQATLKKKKECNAKALMTVEKLCETNIEEEWFLANLQYINQTHFDDVTVERAILKLCGYPLCSQKLEKIPSQQYHISTRYNKVFDISERKNFCSGSCYKAALFVKNQLFTSPLWFRDQEVIPEYKILKSSKSSMGEEVVFSPDKIKPKVDVENKDHVRKEESSDVRKLEEECSKLSISSSEKVADEKKENLEKEEKEEQTKENKDNVEKEEQTKANEEEKKDNVEKKENTIETNAVKISQDNSSKKLDNKPNKVEKSSTKVKMKTETVNCVTKVEKSIFEWFSLETLFYLYKEDKIKELFSDKASNLKEVLNSKLKMASSSEKIERMIKLYGLFDTDSFRSTKMNFKPIPDYSILKEEGKKIEIKVKAFYQGQLEVKNSAKEEVKKEEEEQPETEKETHYLPLIDSHSQVALRRKIVLDKLNRILPELVRIFSTDYILQMSEVRNLVSTFSLAAHNITFKPNEWYLVGIILIKLLSLKDPHLESLLEAESSQNQLTILLTSYELQKNYLNNIIQKLTDSTNIMQKLSEIDR